jgi:hypothetical protein
MVWHSNNLHPKMLAIIPIILAREQSRYSRPTMRELFSQT